MKKLILPLLFCVAIFMSCETETGIKGEISKMEAVADKEPTLANLSQLVAQYDRYVNENPADAETNGRFLYRAAGRLLQANNMRGVTQKLTTGIHDYTSSSVTPNSMLMLAEIYNDKFKDTEKADWYYQALVEKYPNHENAAKAKDKKNGESTLNEMIEAIKDDIYTDSTKVRVSAGKARKLVGLYELYVATHPEDAKSGDYLYTAYELANSARMYREAVKAVENLNADYPDHPKAPTALFLTGYLYENELRNTDKAKKIYEDFLEKYPDNEFAESAKFALANLGKPADQLLKELQEKRGEGGK